LAGNTPTSNASYNGNNQIAGVSYDAAGNQLAVNGDTLIYDAENRQASVAEPQSLGGGTANYLYDGNGQRVSKILSGAITVYAYDALGQLAAEYSTVANTSPCTTCYLAWDHLGTVRLVTDQNADVIARHDYLPFGEEIAGATAARNGLWGPQRDTIDQKFTGQIRDGETGLDFFGARYYGAALGRFTSPDEPFVDQNPADPQSWNLYSYVRNNPLTNTDDDGRAVNVCTNDENGNQSCLQMSNDQYAAAAQGNAGLNVPTLDQVGMNGDGNGNFNSTNITDSNGNVVGSATYVSEGGADYYANRNGIDFLSYQTAPVINATAQGLRMFGYAVAAPAMVAADCLAGAPDCTKGNVAMAVLPELGALKAGGMLLKAGAAAGKGAEIIQKAGGIAQAAKDFEALSGAESVNGAVRVKTFSDGSRAVLYQSTSGPVSIGIQDAAGRTLTKIRY
jgi:RHS repeat-associated protein